ncbi:MAG: SpoIIE family protein phosphatase [Bdellovibrionales bacterium]|nr:SpoIIE family protein phosphatase [Bdellovibrionales bacterium]
MTDDTFRPPSIKISLGAKLLAALTLLIGFSITFLGVTASRLFVEDKERAVFGNQITEALFAGRELNVRLKSAIDLLRSVAVSNPTEAKRIISNQDLLDFAEVFQLNPSATGSGDLVLRFQAHKGDTAEPTLQTQVAGILPQLLASQYLFRNLTTKPAEPKVGVFLAPESKQPGPRIIIVGTLSMKAYLEGLQNSPNEFAITDDAGLTVLDSDFGRNLIQGNLSKDPAFLFSKESPVQSGSKKTSADDQAQLVSYYRTDLGLVVLVKAQYTKMVQAVFSLIEKITLFGLGLLAALALTGTLLFKRITAPIRELFMATQTVAEGNFDVQIRSKSKDEIGALAKAFVYMAARIQKLILDVVEKSRIDQELKIAVTVQKKLLPLPRVSDSQLAATAYYRSASECGGDWWGHLSFPGKTVLCIADATGHGVSAALITASARSALALFEKFATKQPELIHPLTILDFANKAIHSSSQGEILMTYFVAVIDHTTRKIHAASAGHNPQYLILKTDGGQYDIQTLGAAGSRLGEIADLDVNQIQVQTVDYTAGSQLFLYTDGILDGTDANDKPYGRKGLKKALQMSQGQSIDTVLQMVSKDFLLYVGPKPLGDDVTFVVGELR